MRAPARATGPDGHEVGGSHAWRLAERLGSGGTAEVWRIVADDGREAALKRLRPGLEADPRAAELLRHEYRSLRALSHPSFVAPLALVEWDGSLALVLEYLPGGDLVPLLGGPVSQWLAPFKAVVDAVAVLHERGFAHGDLKARNVLFAADGSPRLIDFASVRPLESSMTTTGAEPPGRAGDCLAVATLLYELVTGASPRTARGEAFPAERCAAEAPTDPAARELLAVARAGLARGGRGGLSGVRNVIESVGAARANTCP